MENCKFPKGRIFIPFGRLNTPHKGERAERGFIILGILSIKSSVYGDHFHTAALIMSPWSHVGLNCCHLACWRIEITCSLWSSSVFSYAALFFSYFFFFLFYFFVFCVLVLFWS